MGISIPKLKNPNDRNVDSRTDKGKHNLSMRNTVKSFRKVQGKKNELRAIGLSL